MNNPSTPKGKFISSLGKALIRIAILIIYVCSLFAFNAGAYSLIARKESRKTLVEYNDENRPDYAAVLLIGSEKKQPSEVFLESIHIYADLDPNWTLYQVPGSGKLSVAADYDSCHYVIEEISETRTRARLTYWVGGGDVKQVYVYEIEDNRVYPISYNPRAAYFGWMFGGLPFGFITTFIFIAGFELLIVRRYIFKKPAGHRWQEMNRSIQNN